MNQTPSSSPTRRTALMGTGTIGLGALAKPWMAVAAAADPWATSSWRTLTDAQWRSRLPDASYSVLRRSATEAPFTSPMNKEHRRGVFVCLGCGLPLFNSEWKFDSGTGWPSFFTETKGTLLKKADFAIGIPRTEYHCARCLGHQGHVFDDGPKPTGLRYCNNGVALGFTPA